MAKSELNQVVEQPKYILINLTWESYLLLPIKEGMEYIRLQSIGTKIEGNLRPDRNKALRFSANDSDVTIRYISEEQFKRWRLEALAEKDLEEES